MVMPDLRNYKRRKIGITLTNGLLVEFEAPCSVDADGKKYFHEKDVKEVFDAFDEAINKLNEKGDKI